MTLSNRDPDAGTRSSSNPGQHKGPKSSLNSQKHAFGVNEACHLCGFSRGWLYLEWKAGRGPARIKIGRRTLIRAEALEQWLKSLEQTFPMANLAGGL